VVGIDDVVADLELDVLELRDEVEVLELIFDCFGQGVLLGSSASGQGKWVAGPLRSAGNGRRD